MQNITGIQKIELLASESIDDNLQAIGHEMSRIAADRENRASYQSLIKLVNNPELSELAILNLAELKDSRALFPLLNVYNNANNHIVQKSILQYIRHTQDPRAKQFLEKNMEHVIPEYKEIAKDALESCKDNFNFTYRYAGTDKDWEKIGNPELKPINVTNSAITGIREILEEDKKYQHRKPQTYVITPDQMMKIGGYINEHVGVAQGSDVLAAGEVEFIEIEKNKWEVAYINHRSTGYFPAETAFHWVEQFFRHNTDVKLNKTVYDKINNEHSFPLDGFADTDFLSIFKFGEHFNQK